jgi:hypothetical protein
MTGILDGFASRIAKPTPGRGNLRTRRRTSM